MAVSTIAGNVLGMQLVQVTIDLANVGAATSAEQTFTITGLQTRDLVFVNIPSSLNDGLGVVGARVSAADTLAVRVMNATAGGLNAASATFTVLVVRPEPGSLPTGVAL